MRVVEELGFGVVARCRGGIGVDTSRTYTCLQKLIFLRPLAPSFQANRASVPPPLHPSTVSSVFPVPTSMRVMVPSETSRWAYNSLPGEVRRACQEPEFYSASCTLTCWKLQREEG